MAKTTLHHVCSECGESFSKWMGQCTSCHAWNSLKEFREPLAGKESKTQNGINLKSDTTQTDTESKQQKFSSGIHEFDRVIQEGFFPGSVILFGGHPGVGKSTLSMQVFLHQPDALYFSGEESVGQVFDRAERLGKGLTNASLSKSHIFSTNSLEDIVITLQQEKPPIAIIDSIQMIGTNGASFGTMQTIRENAEFLVKTAKSTGTALVIIGHVTKNDELAGPKVLEHLVDTVLYLEGERETGLRILRSTKNRFGSTLEVGVFTMDEQGLQEVNNPSDYFLAERPENASGTSITAVREGSRNFILELQALTVKTNFGLPKRTSHGIDISKVHLLLAVLSKFTAFPADSLDTYINVIGGLKIKDPSCDLALCGAILSSRTNLTIDAQTIILGEVGLSGEIRSVPFLEARLKEAARLGFTTAIIPANKKPVAPKGMTLKTVRHMGEFMSLMK